MEERDISNLITASEEHVSNMIKEDILALITASEEHVLDMVTEDILALTTEGPELKALYNFIEEHTATPTNAIMSIGEKCVHEVSKNLGRVYSINVHISDNVLKPYTLLELGQYAYQALTLYLILYLRSLDPGFPYRVTLTWDSDMDFAEYINLLNKYATKDHNLLWVDC